MHGMQVQREEQRVDIQLGPQSFDEVPIWILDDEDPALERFFVGSKQARLALVIQIPQRNARPHRRLVLSSMEFKGADPACDFILLRIRQELVEVHEAGVENTLRLHVGLIWRF